MAAAEYGIRRGGKEHRHTKTDTHIAGSCRPVLRERRHEGLVCTSPQQSTLHEMMPDATTITRKMVILDTTRHETTRRTCWRRRGGFVAACAHPRLDRTRRCDSCEKRRAAAALAAAAAAVAAAATHTTHANTRLDTTQHNTAPRNRMHHVLRAAAAQKMHITPEIKRAACIHSTVRTWLTPIDCSDWERRWDSLPLPLDSSPPPGPNRPDAMATSSRLSSASARACCRSMSASACKRSGSRHSLRVYMCVFSRPERARGRETRWNGSARRERMNASINRRMRGWVDGRQGGKEGGREGGRGGGGVLT